MRYVLICPDDLLEPLVGHATLPGDPAVYLVARPALRARLARRGATVSAGDPADPEALRRALGRTRGAAVIGAPPSRLARVMGALREALPEVPVLAITDETRPLPGATSVPLSAIMEQAIRPAVDRAVTRARVERIRRHFEDAQQVLILMQDDPDPDAIASALALKTLLGRTRGSTHLCSFGSITRPENLAMCKILEIEVEEISAQALDEFDRVAMVDVQPSFLEERFHEVDLVIDHHPAERPVRARIRDVRSSYGATSTILLEYLRAADVKVTQRLATALLYGIKSDTLGLERGGTRADLEAYSYLHLLANHGALRRIERPELSEAALDVLVHGLHRRRVLRGVFFSHLGSVPVADLVPQLADFGLQAEGVEWSVVSGVVGEQVHISIRNVGYVRSAGEVARAAFGDLGGAGGHRTMARAVVPLARLTGGEEARAGRGPAERIVHRILRALGHDGREGA